MTREETIAFGKMWLEINEDAKNSSTYEFFQIAIKALEQEPFINKPCVSSGVCEHDKNVVLDKIRAEIESLKRFKIRGEKTPLINGDNVLHILDKYKADKEQK